VFAQVIQHNIGYEGALRAITGKMQISSADVSFVQAKKADVDSKKSAAYDKKAAERRGKKNFAQPNSKKIKRGKTPKAVSESRRLADFTVGLSQSKYHGGASFGNTNEDDPEGPCVFYVFNDFRDVAEGKRGQNTKVAKLQKLTSGEMVRCVYGPKTEEEEEAGSGCGYIGRPVNARKHERKCAYNLLPASVSVGGPGAAKPDQKYVEELAPAPPKKRHRKEPAPVMGERKEPDTVMAVDLVAEKPASAACRKRKRSEEYEQEQEETLIDADSIAQRRPKRQKKAYTRHE
jgi:hypothetical protein